MAMAKIYMQMNEKLDRILAMLEAQAKPASAPIMQVDETTANKMERAGDLTPARSTAAQTGQGGEKSARVATSTPKSK